MFHFRWNYFRLNEPYRDDCSLRTKLSKRKKLKLINYERENLQLSASFKFLNKIYAEGLMSRLIWVFFVFACNIQLFFSEGWERRMNFEVFLKGKQKDSYHFTLRTYLRKTHWFGCQQIMKLSRYANEEDWWLYMVSLEIHTFFLFFKANGFYTMFPLENKQVWFIRKQHSLLFKS